MKSHLNSTASIAFGRGAVLHASSLIMRAPSSESTDCTVLYCTVLLVYMNPVSRESSRPGKEEK